MGDFWKLAVSLTGISGVGAFVFYALYKRWLTPALFKGLGEAAKLKLFQTFLYLTFFFAIATLILAAYNSYIGNNPSRMSIRNWTKTLEDKYSYGEHVFNTLEHDPALSNDQKAAIRTLHANYTLHSHRSREAVVDGDFTRSNEHNKAIMQLFDSQNAKDRIPTEWLENLKNYSCTKLPTMEDELKSDNNRPS